MLVGGLSALLLQSLHPLAMAGVADHSNYALDPTGRLRRTADFVGTTTFGSKEDARRAVETVRRVHRKVHGTAPDGRPYDANDPSLITWVHVAEVSSFLHSAQRFGPHRFTSHQCDDYYEEMAVIALDLGAEWVPRSVNEVKAYYRRVRPELYAGAQALEGRDFLLRGVARKPEDRAVYAVIVLGAISLLPSWAKQELRLLRVPLLDALAVVPLTRTVSAGLRWAVTPAKP